MIEALRNRGWAEIRNVPPQDFVRLAESLGTPLIGPDGVVEQLRIRDKEEAPAKSLSGVFGRANFPLHTDYAHHPVPARFILLRNPNAAPVRPTLVQPLVDLRLTPEDRCSLLRCVWMVRGGRVPFYATVLSGHDQFVRWDPVCMSPGPLGADAALLWFAILSTCKPVSFEWRQHSVLVVDNWRALHGRPGTLMASDSGRLLERIAVKKRNPHDLGK